MMAMIIIIAYFAGLFLSILPAARAVGKLLDEPNASVERTKEDVLFASVLGFLVALIWPASLLVLFVYSRVVRDTPTRSKQ